MRPLQEREGREGRVGTPSDLQSWVAVCGMSRRVSNYKNRT